MNLIKKILIAGCCIVVTGSCKKDNSTPDNYISYKVDGVLKTVKAEASYYPDNSMLIEGGKTGSEEISLFLNGNMKVGRFHFENDMILGTYEDGKTAGGFIADSGTLVISSFDGKTVSGTFEFKGRNSVMPTNIITRNITEGKFMAKVTDYPEPIDSTIEVAGNRNLIGRIRLLQAERSTKTGNGP